jgi:hypothetical protein
LSSIALRIADDQDFITASLPVRETLSAVKQRLQRLFVPEGIAYDGIGSIKPPRRNHF